MEYFVILTLQIPGRDQLTIARVIPVRPGDTRSQICSDVLAYAVDRYGPDMERANIVFFTAEPNQLVTQAQ